MMLEASQYDWSVTGRIALDHTLYLQYHFCVEPDVILECFAAGLMAGDVFEMLNRGECLLDFLDGTDCETYGDDDDIETLMNTMVPSTEEQN